jgi:hypothetical protein
MPKFDVEVSSKGWGDPRFILIDVANAIRSAGATTEEQDQWFTEATSGDAENVLRTAMKWVKVA